MSKKYVKKEFVDNSAIFLLATKIQNNHLFASDRSIQNENRKMINHLCLLADDKLAKIGKEDSGYLDADLFIFVYDVMHHDKESAQKTLAYCYYTKNIRKLIGTEAAINKINEIIEDKGNFINAINFDTKILPKKIMSRQDLAVEIMDQLEIGVLDFKTHNKYRKKISSFSESDKLEPLHEFIELSKKSNVVDADIFVFAYYNINKVFHYDWEPIVMEIKNNCDTLPILVGSRNSIKTLQENGFLDDLKFTKILCTDLTFDLYDKTIEKYIIPEQNNNNLQNDNEEISSSGDDDSESGCVIF